jgi:hypothetical protein
MVAPVLQKGKVSSPQEAPSAKAIKRSMEAAVLQPIRPLGSEEAAPSMNLEHSMVAPAVRQLQISPSESTKKDPNLQPLRPWTVPGAAKAPSVKSGSSHLTLSVRQVRTPRPVEDANAETDSSDGAIHDAPVIQPVEAPAPVAPVKDHTDKESKESDSDNSLGLGNIVGHAPQDLPPQFSRPSKPKVTLLLFTNLTNI